MKAQGKLELSADQYGLTFYGFYLDTDEEELSYLKDDVKEVHLTVDKHNNSIIDEDV